MKTKVVVRRNDVDPEPIEIIAANIQKIADGVDRINSSKLNRRAIVLLVSHASGVSGTNVGAVLDSLNNLRATYLK